MKESLMECKKCGYEYDESFMVKKTEGYDCVYCAYESTMLEERVILLEDI